MTTNYDEFDTVYAPPGKAIDDGGSQFESVQAAVDNATDWVLVGPGTFNEAVSYSKDHFELIGSGPASHIDATGTGSGAIDTQDSAHPGIRNIKVTGDPNNNGASGVTCNNNPDGGDSPRLIGVVVADSGGNGIHMSATNSTIMGCQIRSAGNHGIKILDAGALVSTVQIGSVDNWAMDFQDSHCQASVVFARGSCQNGVRVQNNDVDLSNVRVKDVNTDGMEIQGNDVTVDGFRITGAGDQGLIVSGADDQFDGGHVSGSTNADVTDTNATRPRWNDVIGGGPLTHIDLTSETGASAGDWAIANGTSTSASDGDLARFDGTDWNIWNVDATQTPA